MNDKYTMHPTGSQDELDIVTRQVRNTWGLEEPYDSEAMRTFAQYFYSQWMPPDVDGPAVPGRDDHMCAFGAGSASTQLLVDPPPTTLWNNST